MKYIKTNESFREEKEEAIIAIEKKYESIIDDALQQLIDISIKNVEKVWDGDGCCRNYFHIDMDNISYDELSSTLTDSIDKLEFNGMECFLKLRYTVSYSENLDLKNALERIRLNYKAILKDRVFVIMVLVTK